MANVDPVSVENRDGTRRSTWVLANGDVGIAIPFGSLSDKTFQVFGDFFGATVAIEGSLEAEPTTWFPLTDTQGNAISKTDDAGEIIIERVSFIRPATVTGGDSGGTTAVTVIVLSGA